MTQRDFERFLASLEADPARWSGFHRILKTHAPLCLANLIASETKWSPDDPPPSWDKAVGLQLTLYDNWLYNGGKRPRKGRKAGAKSMPNAQKVRYQLELEVFGEKRRGKWWFGFLTPKEIRTLAAKRKGREWMVEWGDVAEDSDGILIGFARSKVNGNGTKYHEGYLAVFDVEQTAVVIQTPHGNRAFKNPATVTMQGKPLFDPTIIEGKVKSSSVAAWRVGRNPNIKSTAWASHPWTK